MWAQKYLCIDIHAGEPAAEGRVGVVPPHNHLGPLGLLEHVEHVLLVDRVHRFHADWRAWLRHCEHVHYSDGVVVDHLPDQQPHHFQGHPCSRVLQHFQQGQGWDEDLFRRVWFVCGFGVALAPAHSAKSCQAAQSSHVKHFKKYSNYNDSLYV